MTHTFDFSTIVRSKSQGNVQYQLPTLKHILQDGVFYSNKYYQRNQSHILTESQRRINNIKLSQSAPPISKNEDLHVPPLKVVPEQPSKLKEQQEFSRSVTRMIKLDKQFFLPSKALLEQRDMIRSKSQTNGSEKKKTVDTFRNKQFRILFE